MICEHCGRTNDVGSLVCLWCGREQRGDAPVARDGAVEAPVAHAQACPKHPVMPVAGACPRCGTFVCIRCAPGAASGALTCSDCLARNELVLDPSVSPFGGLLVLPLLGLVFNLLAFAGAVVFLRLRAEPLGAMQVALAVLAVLIGVTSFGFLQRRRWVPWAMIGIYAADIVIASLSEGAARGWIAWCIVWLGYFLGASRVKRTFTG